MKSQFASSISIYSTFLAVRSQLPNSHLQSYTIVQEYHSVPLRVAAEMGYTDTVGRLLKGGANINDTDKVRDISISRITHLEIF